ncbi:unnamed protein product, partial [Polarella glacialis]
MLRRLGLVAPAVQFRAEGSVSKREKSKAILVTRAIQSRLGSASVKERRAKERRAMQWESSSSQMMYHYDDQAFAQNQMDMFSLNYAAQVTVDSHGPASHPGDWQHVDNTWQRHMLQTDDGHMLQVIPMVPECDP